MSYPANPSPDPTISAPSRPRRAIPVSLRTFVTILVLLAVIGALCVGVPAYRQHVAIREIELVGGTVQTNECCPAWLRGAVGAQPTQAFEKVIAVDLFRSVCSDDSLAHLSALTETGLAHLKGLTSLQGLWLQNTCVTDAGVAELQIALPKLSIGR